MEIRSVALLSAFLFVGCMASERTELKSNVTEGGAESFSPAEELEMNCEAMDVLFVIDNSPSMGDQQRALREKIGEFSRKLKNLKTNKGAPLDLNVGVTTTSIAKRIVNPETRRESNTRGHGGTLANLHCYGGELWKMDDDTDLSCLTNVGLAGSNIEMPLESIRQIASQENQEQNEGFIRKDALLATIVITDEDDCSYSKDTILADNHEAFCEEAESIDYFADQIYGAEASSSGWVSWIVGANHSCDDYEGEFPGDSRLERMADSNKNTTGFSSICENSLSSSLDLAFERFARACHSYMNVE